MHFETSWSADGLRWIASLFQGAADYLERIDARPCERRHTDLLPPDDPADQIRARIHTRYY